MLIVSVQLRRPNFHIRHDVDVSRVKLNTCVPAAIIAKALFCLLLLLQGSACQARFVGFKQNPVDIFAGRGCFDGMTHL